MSKWTPEEIEILKANWIQNSKKTLLLLPEKGEQAVRRKASKLGLLKGTHSKPVTIIRED